MADNKERLIPQPIELEQQTREDGLTDLNKQTETEVSSEISGLMREITEPDKTEIKDQDNTTILKPVEPKSVKIMIPTSKENFLSGLTKPVEFALRWLTKFFKRQEDKHTTSGESVDVEFKKAA